MAEGDGETRTTGDAPSVFVSYATQDAAIANSIVEALENAGIRCWIAPRDVKPGAQYADAIVRAINEAKAVVLVLSANAVSSSHVGREVERAASKHKRIIALRLDAEALNPALEYFLSESQWINVPSLGMSAALASITEAVGQRSATSAQGIPSGKRPLRAPGVGMRLTVAAAAVIGLGAVVALGLHLWRSSRSATQAPAIAASNAPRANTKPGAAISNKSVAVLPFVDLSEKQDQQYLGDGIAEQVLDVLSRVPGLKVVGRTSSFQFRGPHLDARSIGAQLGVGHLLQGSVRRSGGTLRVTAVLVGVTDGASEWSESYDNSLDDVLKVQDAIAVSIARALEISIGDSIIAAPRPVNPAAYDLYLKGTHAFDLFTREGCEEAIGLFTQALQIDPKFAPAAVGIAWSYDRIGQNGWMPTPLAYQRAREYALRSLEIDPKLAAAHTVLAGIKLVYDWDWRGARDEIDKAFALGGRNSAGLAVAGRVASAINPASDEALAFLREATALDPLNAEAHIVLGYWVYARTGRFADAERAMRRGLQINPKWGSGHYFLAIDLLMLGRLDEAMEEANKETTEDGRFEALAEIYHAQHRKAESDAALREAIAANGDNWAGAIALAYAFRGEANEALRWLERAYAQHDEELYLIKGDPQLRSLEPDPRYRAFLRKMNLSE